MNAQTNVQNNKPLISAAPFSHETRAEALKYLDVLRSSQHIDPSLYADYSYVQEVGNKKYRAILVFKPIAQENQDS